MDGGAIPWRGVISGATLACLPLVVWPSLERPFSTPKLWIAALMSVAFWLLIAMARRTTTTISRPLVWAACAWIISFILSTFTADLPSFEATLLGLTAPAFALAVVRLDAPARLTEAQTVGAGLVAVVAIVQWFGIDPFNAIGWHAPLEGASVRMRVYGTLGNPNFVGVLMAMSLPLAGARLIDRWNADRRFALAIGIAIVLQALALLATGSRGAVMGLAAGVVAWASVRWSARASAALLLVLLFGGAAIALSPARPLQMTIEGRVYLWQVVAPHAGERLVTGYGPGAVALRFPRWQRTAAARGVEDPRFAGLTDHAHNDYLEALIERGVAGLVTLGLPIATGYVSLRRRRRPPSLLWAGHWAAVIAGATCALVDFPLARPVELIWWWIALAQVHLLADVPPDS